MKKRYLLFLTFSIVIVSLAIFNLGSDDKQYTPRNSNNLVQSYADAADLFEALRANPETGEVDFALYRKIKEDEKAYRAEKGESSLDLSWHEVGPDNIGGRTRAILIVDEDLMLAGSTSGGLFKTYNRGNTWERITSFKYDYAVSSMALLGNGHIYVATGSSSELKAGSHSGYGGGLFVSTDNGDTWDYALDGNDDPIKPANFGGGDYSIIDVIVADPIVDNKLWVGSNVGLEPYVEGTGFLAIPNGLPSSICESLSMSDDGSVIAASVGSDNFYLSTDGGENFEDRAGSGDDEIPSNASRLIVAVSPDNPNFIYGIITLGLPGSFGGVYASSNKGETFELIWPGDVPEVNIDRPNNSSPIGWYALSMAVVPESPGLIVVGCLDVWTGGIWAQPEQRSFWGLNEFGVGTPALDGSIYVHADVCTFEFDGDQLYIGSDGGVARSYDGAETFTTANRFYNVTQYYGIGFTGDDKLIGGSQDNGTTFIPKTQATTEEAYSVNGGDGFDCDASSLDPDGNVLFSSIYFNDIYRSNDAGMASMTPMYNFEMAMQPAPFKSQLRLWEDGNSVTPYIVDYINETGDLMHSGDAVTVESRSWGYTFTDTLQADLEYRDTAQFNDIATSLLAVGYSTSGGVWVTRGATYFSEFPKWAKVLNSVTGSVTALEWSKEDGNYLWVGTSNGTIYRISGFANAWEVGDMHLDSADYSLSVSTINGGGYISDIAIDPNDEDHVIFSLAGFGGNSKVKESTNATSSSFSFSNVWFPNGDPLDGLPVYTCLIEASNPNTFIVGTEFGIYATDNGGDDWSPESSEPLGSVITYDIRQQWRDPSLVDNAGYIYVGTFGRGAFRSTDYEKNYIGNGVAAVDNELVGDLVIMPNPMSEFGWLNFNSSIESDVDMDIYNINGQIVKSLKFTMEKGANHLRFDVNDLGEGSYILQLRNDNKVTTDRFVIIR